MIQPIGIPSFDVDLFSDELLIDPYPTYRVLRDAAPVVWVQPLEMYCVARYEEARKVLSDHDIFVSSRGVGFNNFLNQAFNGTIIQSDPPAHTALRRTLAQHMSPQAMRELQAGVDAQADALIEHCLGLGTFDGVRDLAAVFPLTVVAHLIGIPSDGRDRLLSWGDANFNVIGPENERHLQAKPAFVECFEYIQWIDQDPGRLRSGSLGAAIYEAAERGEIRQDQCPALLTAYLVAGIDTTISSIASALSLFGRHPDQWALLRNDPSLVSRAYNEVLRVESPVLAFKRVLSCNAELSGAQLPANASVAVLYASANRDERKFERPERFDVTRASASQLAFGHGIHVCAGQALARLEAGSLLNSMIKRVERIEVGLETRHLNNSVRSLETLEVRFQ